jgi:tetrahydromethanopterin S-methyltransferase subunit G
MYKALTIFFLLCSCSAVTHLKLAEKHIVKAAQKDPGIIVNRPDTVIERDTTTVLEFINDTIREVVTINNTIKPDCPEYDFSKVRNNSQRRQEERTKRKLAVENRKLEKELAKQKGKTDRFEAKMNMKLERIKKNLTQTIKRQNGKSDRKWSKVLYGFVIGFIVGDILTFIVFMWLRKFKR